MTYQQKTTYQRVKASMASPTEQVAILLDKVATNIRQANLLLKENRYEDYFLKLERSLAILNGLCGIISPGKDAPADVQNFAREMESVFAGLSVQISMIDRENCDELCETIIQATLDTSRLWRQAAQDEKPKEAAGPVAEDTPASPQRLELNL